MVTLFHTLLHFCTLNHTILSPTACVAASTRKPGVSKSHLLSVLHSIYAHTQAIAAGPIYTYRFKPPCLWQFALSKNSVPHSLCDLLLLPMLPVLDRLDCSHTVQTLDPQSLYAVL